MGADQKFNGCGDFFAVVNGGKNSAAKNNITG